MAVVRNSKFRHVFGTEARKENSYEGFRVTNCAFEGYFIAANKKFVAFCVEVGGGGAFMVHPVDKTGRLNPDAPKVSAHKEYVLDLQWNPFNDNMLASCSEDGSIKIWDVPEKGFSINVDDSKALLQLEYHERRCIQILWHPIASNVLMSVSQEPKVCIWNLDEGVAEVEITQFPDTIYNASWSVKGDRIVTSCKDKKFRIFDARSGDLVVCGGGHEGSKPQRVIFTFNDKFLFSCGFSKMSERQYGCWLYTDSEITEGDIGELDTANGCLIPYYDADHQMVYLAAKGDSVIRYYELVEEEPYFHYISTYQSKDAQRGLAIIPKRSVDVNTCEVMRFYKLTSGKTGIIKPVSFTVPRKSDLFQDDLYPDAVDVEAAQEASDWFEGKDVLPARVEMSKFFVGKVRPKPGAGGGLKKSGLKGLKAKKEAKKEDTAKPVEKKEEPPKKEEPKRRSPSPEPQTVKPSQMKSSASSSSSSGASAAAAGADPKVVKELQSEVKTLKDNEKKMQKELTALTDKLKDYDKLTSDIKLLCDAVKKNDERIASLEALVQEESEEDGE